MELLSQAICFAAEAYDGIRRKGDGTPLVLHALEAAAIAATLTGDIEVLAAAALHDAVEDAGVRMEEIEARFGVRVAALVGADTENKRRSHAPDETWRIRKEESIAALREARDEGVPILFLADKLSNLRSICRQQRRIGERVWQAFHQKDPAEHHWYYRAIADAMPQLAHTDAWQEYDRLIHAAFGTPQACDMEAIPRSVCGAREG